MSLNVIQALAPPDILLPHPPTHTHTPDFLFITKFSRSDPDDMQAFLEESIKVYQKKERESVF